VNNDRKAPKKKLKLSRSSIRQLSNAEAARIKGGRDGDGETESCSESLMPTRQHNQVLQHLA
jgi:hypothetical protein